MSATFSVLMSVYARERAECLFTSLESIFNQTHLPDEVVLVEDGPLTDGLYKIISDFRQLYPSLKVISLPQNVGLGRALNEGLSHCSHRLVARMDSDDICMPDRFEQQLTIFEQHPELSLVGGWISEFEGDPSKVTSFRKLPETDEELKVFFRSKNPMNHMSVMFVKDTVLEAGGYQDFYLLEDYWLWARMIKNGAQLYNVQRVLVNVRGGAAMAARRGGWKYAMSEVRFFKTLRKIGLIGNGTVIKNIIIRFPIRISPNKLRTLVYEKILR